MTITLQCSCGARLVLASGCVAQVMTPERRAELAARMNWSAYPERCAKCRDLPAVVEKKTKGKDQT